VLTVAAVLHIPQFPIGLELTNQCVFQDCNPGGSCTDLPVV
jgi:hypothetical protein